MSTLHEEHETDKQKENQGEQDDKQDDDGLALDSLVGGLAGGAAATLVDRAIKAVNRADMNEAKERVAQLRDRRPDATDDELAETLIKNKCIEAAAVGAATSGAVIMPGLGSIAALTLGTVADVSFMLKLQAELVLELAELYDRQFSVAERQKALLLVTGVSTGANQLASTGGRKLAAEATEKVASKSLVKAIPFIGIATSAGINIVSTYVIGRRAQSYMKLGPESLTEWSESVRAITGIDERKLKAWLTEAATASWHSTEQNAKALGQSIAVGVSKLGASLGSAARMGASSIRQRFGQHNQGKEPFESNDS